MSRVNAACVRHDSRPYLGRLSTFPTASISSQTPERPIAGKNDAGAVFAAAIVFARFRKPVSNLWPRLSLTHADQADDWAERGTGMPFKIAFYARGVTSLCGLCGYGVWASWQHSVGIEMVFPAVFVVLTIGLAAVSVAACADARHQFRRR